jgi:dUTP pyrophosphatase
MPKSPAKRQKIRVVVMPHGRDLPLPKYQTVGAAGLDLVAAIPADAPVKIKRGGRALIPTGLVIELPRGYEAQIRPRSGLALRAGVTVLNSPGTVDSDYRGEMQVLLINLGEAAFTVQRGDRIAQMVIAPVTQVDLTEAVTVRATKRGAGGYGSTGTSAATIAAKAPAKKAQKPAAKRKKALAVAFPRRSVKTPTGRRR